MTIPAQPHAAASLMLLAAILVSAASPTMAQEAKPDVIRIGSGAAGPAGRLGSQGVIGIVYAKKFLDEELAKSNDAVKVEWNFFRGAGPATNEAFGTKSIDFAYYGDFPIIIGRAGGLKIKIVAGGERGAHSYLIVPPNSTAKSIEDLKGKRIGLHRGRPWELAYAQLLKSKKLTRADLQTFNVSQGDAQAGLASGNVDAIFTGSDGFAITDQGQGKIIWSTREAPAQWRYAADLVVAEEFEAKYPASVQKVVDAFVKASLYLSDENNRDEAFKIWAETGLPVTNYSQERVGELLKSRNNPILDDYLVSHYQLAIDHVKEAALIRRGFPASDLFETKYQRESIKRLKLENVWHAQSSDGKAEN